jgi:hypothetical protein
MRTTTASRTRSGRDGCGSLLKRGFAGRRVPQDPNDEPAAKLVERIRAETRGAGPGGPSDQGTAENQEENAQLT